MNLPFESVPKSYRKAARRLRQWLEPNARKNGYPNRSMDDDLAQAASLLDAAAQIADALKLKRTR